MNSTMSPARLLFAAGCFVFLSLPNKLPGEEWPEGYVVYENTESPDERYGILVPTYEASEKEGSLTEKNYLADLKNHRLLGKIAGADYFEHENHRGLKTIWAEDSSWCIVQYDDRF